MARALDAGFADIITLARARLTQVSIEEDSDADRAILTVEGRFDGYRVVLDDHHS